MSNEDEESSVEMEMEDTVRNEMTMVHAAGSEPGQSRVMMSESLAMTLESEENDNDDHNNNNPTQQTATQFPKLSALQANGNRSEYRRVRCPPHRYTPLREHWEQILTPLVDYLKLQVS
jgi:hypothetical protein